MVGVSTAFPAHRSPDPDQDPDQDQYASWDEVNVVAHGLLQLGQGLKEHVDKTKAQTRDINTRLKLLDATVVEVERRWREQEEALRARSSQVEEREKLLAEVAQEVRGKVEEVKKQSQNMDQLEKKVEEGGAAGASLVQVRGAPSGPGSGGGVRGHLTPAGGAGVCRRCWRLRTAASTGWWRRWSSKRTSWTSRASACRGWRARWVRAPGGGAGGGAPEHGLSLHPAPPGFTQESAAAEGRKAQGGGATVGRWGNASANPDLLTFGPKVRRSRLRSALRPSQRLSAPVRRRSAGQRRLHHPTGRVPAVRRLL